MEDYSGIDSMDAMMTQLGFSKQGRLDDAATQKRSNGDQKIMNTRWLLTMKIDTSMDKYEGKVVPPSTTIASEEIKFLGVVK